MLISDWSSDVCSSDLETLAGGLAHGHLQPVVAGRQAQAEVQRLAVDAFQFPGPAIPAALTRGTGETGHAGDGQGCASRDMMGTDPIHGYDRARLLYRRIRPATRKPAVAYGIAAISQASRSEEHTSELQSLMRSSYAVFCWTKTTTN